LYFLYYVIKTPLLNTKFHEIQESCVSENPIKMLAVDAHCAKIQHHRLTSKGGGGGLRHNSVDVFSSLG
jgi:hypothetical protein